MLQNSLEECRDSIKSSEWNSNPVMPTSTSENERQYMNQNVTIFVFLCFFNTYAINPFIINDEISSIKDVPMQILKNNPSLFHSDIVQRSHLVPLIPESVHNDIRL